MMRRRNKRISDDSSSNGYIFIEKLEIASDPSMEDEYIESDRIAYKNRYTYNNKLTY
jgi:hypothetical protein